MLLPLTDIVNRDGPESCRTSEADTCSLWRIILTRRDAHFVLGLLWEDVTRVDLVLSLCTFALASVSVYVCVCGLAGCDGCVTTWSTYATLKCAS